MIGDKNYTVLHCHTEQSLLDSCTNYKLYVDKCVENGQKAIAFTEHGNINLWVEKKLYCDKNDIKFIFGVECYLTETLDEKKRDNYHTILLAKNQDGIKEINRLMYNSTLDSHFYYKPRITFDEFLSISDNVIKISACLASPLNGYRLGLHLDNRLFDKYDYYEIQPHNNDEQKDYNLWLVEMAEKHNKPLVATGDFHSSNDYKAECRLIFQLGSEAEFSKDDDYDLTYKNHDDFRQCFINQGVLNECVIDQALENTNIIADMVEDFELDTSFKYPILYGEDDEKMLLETLNQKYKEKLANNIIDKKDADKYISNVKEEMRVFKKVGMTGFMLFMSEMITWCWENDIPVGFCRGSVGGSTVAYLSDIIDVDPIKWHTIFSRFCNEDRVEVGDIDIDISPDQRELVYNYIIDRFGKENTAYILANGTVVDKGTIDVIGKALRIKWNREHGLNDKYKGGDNPYNLNKIKEIKELYEQDNNKAKEEYKDLFYYFDGILNTVKSQSMHPAGILASPINLVDNYGCFNKDGKNIIYLNMEECHEVSLIKYDILGLRNIQVIRDTCKYANIPYPKAHLVDWDDKEVWKHMCDSPVGIFQFESQFASECLRKMHPTKINDMSMANAALRPSGESYRERLFAGEVNHNPSEQIDELLKDNRGFLCFQEDTIKFLQNICGLSGSEADNVRRAIGRKQLDRLQKSLPQILEGYCSKSDKPREIAEKEAKEFLQIIEDSSNYQFGYNHSTGYSMIGYVCAYLRHYYFIEFCTSLLNNAGNEEDINNATQLAFSKNIDILPPVFGKSKGSFWMDKSTNSIYKGIGSIKDMNNTIGDNLYEYAQNGMPQDFFDILVNVKELEINKTQLTKLIRIGYFNQFGTINELLIAKEIYNTYGTKKTLKKPCEFDVDGCFGKETEKQYSQLDNLALCRKIFAQHTIPPDSEYALIQNQIEIMGYTMLTVPNAPMNYFALQGIEVNKYGTPFVKLYRLYDGGVIECKMDKKYFEEHPFNKDNSGKFMAGQIMKCAFKDKEKRKKVDGNWVLSGEFEYVLSAYVDVEEE